MAEENLREIVEKELKNLDKESMVRFAWVCAVRALPILGYKGDFSFWKPKRILGPVV
jgi:hypothetical protein